MPYLLLALGTACEDDPDDLAQGGLQPPAADAGMQPADGGATPDDDAGD